jgi:ATP-dependent DNA ligase
VVERAEIQALLKGSVKAEIPVNIELMAFKLSPEPFNDEAWQFEIKWDGFRILSYAKVRRLNSNLGTTVAIIKDFLL